MRASGADAITPTRQPREGGRKLKDSAAHSRTGVIREIDQPLRRLQRLPHVRGRGEAKFLGMRFRVGEAAIVTFLFSFALLLSVLTAEPVELPRCRVALGAELGQQSLDRSEEHTSELQSLMRISYAVFCLKKKKTEEK